MTQRATSNRYILLIAGVAALGGLLFGYDTGVIGGAQLYFTEYFQFTAAQQGWAVSSALYGCLLGAGVAGYLCSALSRKWSLILSGALFIVSAWGSGIPESLNELVVYRIIGGVGVGIASMAAPMYIAEISPPARRGRLVSFYQLAIVVGFFIVFLATYFIGGAHASEVLTPEQREAVHAYNVQHGWRVMFWSELVPAGLFTALLFFVPFSPRWLVLRGRNEEALTVLRRISDSEEEAQDQFREILQSLEKKRSEKRVSLLSKRALPVVIIGTILSVMQQVTGINAILYYGAEIFSSALGFGPENALEQQLILGAVNLVFTFVAIRQVDRWGRKPLLIAGVLGMLAGLLVVGLSLYTNTLGIGAFLGILLFIGSFALSMGPVTWVLLAEMFPNSYRAAAMSVAVGAQWLFNALVANSFPLLVRSELNSQVFNGALPYAFFALMCLVTVLFVWRFIPETKGKTLEELESVWEKK